MAWLDGQAARRRCQFSEKPLEELEGWIFDANSARLRHRSRRFFDVGGIEVQTEFLSPHRWRQPVLEQFEIGLLGSLVRNTVRGSEILVQAKGEPGDIMGVQAAPTLQATRSNWRRVHKGDAPHYLEQFRDPGTRRRLANIVQPEHGGFFLRKYNRNLLLYVAGEEPEPVPGYRWLSLAELRALLVAPNRVNMSLRSVIASLAGAGAPSMAVPDWFRAFAANRSMALRRTEFLRQKTMPPRFTIRGISVEADREVAHWDQPILCAVPSRVEQYVCRRDGRLGFLVRAAAEPGHRSWLALGPTHCGYASDSCDPRCAGFAQRLRELPGVTLYEQSLSEDGGRFLHFENRHRIVQLADEPPGLPPGFGWVDAAALLSYAHQGLLTVELRTIVAWHFLETAAEKDYLCPLGASLAAV